MSDYDGLDDARKCWAAAIEAIRGRAFVRHEPNGYASLTAHKWEGGKVTDLTVPLTRKGLEILQADIAILLRDYP